MASLTKTHFRNNLNQRASMDHIRQKCVQDVKQTHHFSKSPQCCCRTVRGQSATLLLTETQSRPEPKVRRHFEVHLLAYMDTHSLPFLLVIQMKKYLILQHCCIILYSICAVHNWSTQNSIFRHILQYCPTLNRAHGQMSAAHRQWQASAEQNADPEIAIHYQENDWCQKRSVPLFKIYSEPCLSKNIRSLLFQKKIIITSVNSFATYCYALIVDWKTFYSPELK